MSKLASTALLVLSLVFLQGAAPLAAAADADAPPVADKSADDAKGHADATDGAATEASESAPAAAPPVLDVTDPDATKAAVGQTVTVEAEVVSAAWSKSGKVLLVELKGTERSRFMLAAFVKFRTALDEGFDGDVAKALATGRRVRATGEVKLYKQRPEILLEKPEQLQILDAPAPAAETLEER